MRRVRRAGPDPIDATVAETVDQYVRLLPTLTSAWNRPYSPRTIVAYAEHLRPFATWCGTRALCDLAADDIGLHLAQLRAAGRSEAWVATRDKVLRTWLSWCVDRDLVARSPLAKTRRLVAPETPIERLADADVRQLLGACDRKTWGGVRDAALVLVLWRTGLRVSEVCGLDLGDYDPVRRHLSIRHGKGDRPRLVGVPDDTAAALDDFIAHARGHAPGPLIPNETDGRFDRRNMALILQRRSAKAGIRHVHPHLLRHTFACNFLLAGGDLEILRRILGHADMRMVQRYLRSIQDEEAADEHVRVLRPERWGRR